MKSSRHCITEKRLKKSKLHRDNIHASLQEFKPKVILKCETLKSFSESQAQLKAKILSINSLTGKEGKLKGETNAASIPHFDEITQSEKGSEKC